MVLPARSESRHRNRLPTEPLSLAALTSQRQRDAAASRLSSADPWPLIVLWTAAKKSLETLLYLSLIGADGRGTAFKTTFFHFATIGCAAATRYGGNLPAARRDADILHGQLNQLQRLLSLAMAEPTLSALPGPDPAH
jgi:hypothetical protein